MGTDFQKHFQLLDNPYHPTPSTRYLYISPTHNIALEKTKWAVTTRNGLSICFGKTGTGKTTVARELLARLGDLPGITYVYIANPEYSTPNRMLRAIVKEFQVPETSKNYMELLNIFKDFLIKEAVDQKKTLVLLIDEAQKLKAPLIEMLRVLMNYETNDEKLLQIVLFAQEEFRGRLVHPRYENFVNRVVISASIETLTLDETAAMLKHRWWIASNGRDNFPFAQDAIDKIYLYSKGIPRTQIVIAQNALVSASLYGRTAIHVDLIDEVTRNRNLPDTALEQEEKQQTEIERRVKVPPQKERKK